MIYRYSNCLIFIQELKIQFSPNKTWWKNIKIIYYGLHFTVTGECVKNGTIISAYQKCSVFILYIKVLSSPMKPQQNAKRRWLELIIKNLWLFYLTQVINSNVPHLSFLLIGKRKVPEFSILESKAMTTFVKIKG